MKIVDYETFIRMPAGTIFAPFTPCVFQNRFEIKVDGGWEDYHPITGKKRWYFNGTMPLEPWNANELFEGCDETEASFEVYDGDSTDASSYKLFCVLQPNDVEKLISALYWALDGCPCELEEYHDSATKRVEEFERVIMSNDSALDDLKAIFGDKKEIEQ